MKYLIMSCVELGDQWECDADRTPITMCDDWKSWYAKNKKKIDYCFEVYEFNGEEFLLIKNYDDY